MTYFEAMQALAEMLPEEGNDPRIRTIANEMGAAAAELAMLRGTVGAQEAAIRNLREDLGLETALAVSWRKRFDEASSVLRLLVGMDDWGDLNDPVFDSVDAVLAWAAPRHKAESSLAQGAGFRAGAEWMREQAAKYLDGMVGPAHAYASEIRDLSTSPPAPEEGKP